MSRLLLLSSETGPGGVANSPRTPAPVGQEYLFIPVTYVSTHMCMLTDTVHSGALVPPTALLGLSSLHSAGLIGLLVLVGDLKGERSRKRKMASS